MKITVYEVQEPLKELIKLRAENKKLNEMIQGLEHELDAVKDARPEPCTRFKNSTKKEWAAKINEEVGEVIEAMYDPNKSTHDLLREMVDVVTVIRSMEYAARFTDTEIAQMQCWVNNNNRERGYMNEPERQTDSHEKREN